MKYLICVAFLISVAAVSHEDFAPEDEFLQASERLQVLVKSGKSNDECIKGGKTAIKEVIKERESAQKVLYKMPNGSHCKFKRSKEVTAARNRVKATQIALNNAKTHLKTNMNKKITVSLTYKTTNSNCGTLFRTTVWKKHRTLIKKLTKIRNNASAKLSSAKNGLTIALRDQRLAQCKCKATVIKNADTALTAAKKLTAGRKKTIRRELLLICLAKVQGKKNGYGMSQCKSASLPSKYNSKLALFRTKLIKWNNRFRCNAHRGYGSRWTNGDKCKGFFIPKSCDGQIAFSLRYSNSWSRYQTYQCPVGWKWASSNQYTNKVNELRRRGRRCNGYAYYSRCGWSGYPSRGQTKYKFRFSNSRNNPCYYQHAGNYIYSLSSTCSASEFGGIVCIRTY